MARKSLQDDLKKKQPFASIEQEAALHLLRTSDQFQNRFLRLLRPYGLTPSQYNVLRILRGEGQPLPMLEIANRMIQVVPAMTGLIDRLEKQGLVRRDRCAEDRRVIFIVLTDKGVNLLNDVDEPLLQLHQALLSHMSNSELRQMCELLEKARQNLGSISNGD